MVQPDRLKQLIDTSIAASKPNFAEMDPARIARLIQRDVRSDEPVAIFNVRGSDEKAGASSGIVIFDATIAGTTGHYVLRYAPLNNDRRLMAEYAIVGQAGLQRALNRIGLPVPQVHWVDPDGEVLGLPGMIMERIDGVVPNGSAFTGGLIAEAGDAARSALFDEVARALGKVHAVDWQRHGLERFTRSDGGATPIERYINWFWKSAVRNGSARMDRLVRVRDWLFANQPFYHRDDHTLIHGDPGLSNYMFRDNRIAAIIDWEFAGIVHPSCDIATQCGMARFFRSSASPETARIIPSETDWIARYERISGRRVEDFEFFRRMTALFGVIVSLTMNRNMPEELRPAHLESIEEHWSVAEGLS